MGKMTADDFPRRPENKVNSAGVLDLIHTDVVGPMKTKTPGGCIYIAGFTDDFSRLVSAYFMRHKSELQACFRKYKSQMEVLSGCKIKRVCSDNGGDYTSNKFNEFLADCGIKHEYTVPYTPQQNGLAERMNRNLVDMARCMLHHRGVDQKWWAEAVNTAAWLLNRLPNSVNTRTPYEIVYKKRPVLNNVKVFGSIGYAHVPAERRKKFDPKAFKCMFLGYSDNMKGSECWSSQLGECIWSVRYGSWKPGRCKHQPQLRAKMTTVKAPIWVRMSCPRYYQQVDQFLQLKIARTKKLVVTPKRIKACQGC